MTLNPSQVEKLLTYTGKIELTQLGISMMVTRLSNNYKKAPNPQTLQSATTEINGFLKKYESIAGKDYKWIISL